MDGGGRNFKINITETKTEIGYRPVLNVPLYWIRLKNMNLGMRPHAMLTNWSAILLLLLLLLLLAPNRDRQPAPGPPPNRPLPPVPRPRPDSPTLGHNQ